jgi:hypothetical protein
MIHPQTDWTPEEAQHLKHTRPGQDYYFVLAQVRYKKIGYSREAEIKVVSTGMVVVGAYSDLEEARVKRREYCRGQVRVGRITPDFKGTLNVCLE